MDDKYIIINNETFKQLRINKTYYISQSGRVYSCFSQKIIKPHKRGRYPKEYYYVDIWLNGRQRHIPIHRLVYDTWVEPITRDDQINHIDDNPLNNHIDNLYKGTQKQNIQDCVNNNNRVGNTWYLTIKDKQENKILTFAPASDFIAYCGHPNKSKSLNKFFQKNWFKKRYEIIEFKRIKDINHLQSVTTMADECKPVE